MKLSPDQALRLWHDVTVMTLRQAHTDLTTRQFALLLQVYLLPQPHTVRVLSSNLAMSKPAVTRALDRLCRLGFLRRKRIRRTCARY